MGARENAEVIRRGYEAFNSGDLETLAELIDENVVWHVPGRSSLAGDYQGREATFGYFGRLAEETGGTVRAEPRHLVADDELVVGIQRNSAERKDKRLDVENCLVFRLEGGRVTEAWEHYDDLYAWDSFWS
jgi:uncharacterized protein